jgi:hypothetical protein
MLFGRDRLSNRDANRVLRAVLNNIEEEQEDLVFPVRSFATTSYGCPNTECEGTVSFLFLHENDNDDNIYGMRLSRSDAERFYLELGKTLATSPPQFEDGKVEIKVSFISAFGLPEHD